jgi:hypothetical protein
MLNASHDSAIPRIRRRSESDACLGPAVDLPDAGHQDSSQSERSIR